MSTVKESPNNGLTAEQTRFYAEEGYLVLPHLLDDSDMAPARAAMMEKVDRIADELIAAGLVSDRLEEEPFETRLARLFEDLSDAVFLKYGRSWRERRAGYYHLMANPKIIDAVESLIGGEIFANPVYNVRPKYQKSQRARFRGTRINLTGRERTRTR